VKQVWDYKPDASRMAAESGWRAASEVKPDLVDNREIMTTHSFDLDADPAQIVWGKRELTVDERKGALIGQANAEFQEGSGRAVRKQLERPWPIYDASVILMR
jgi:hypothetical protein